jgi:hypothetical protein
LLCFWHQIRNQSPYPRSPNLACFIWHGTIPIVYWSWCQVISCPIF